MYTIRKTTQGVGLELNFQEQEKIYTPLVILILLNRLLQHMKVYRTSKSNFSH